MEEGRRLGHREHRLATRPPRSVRGMGGSLLGSEAGVCEMRARAAQSLGSQPAQFIFLVLMTPLPVLLN